MSRKDALLRLHKSLVEKRESLRKQLAGDLDAAASNGQSSDVVDAAADGSQSELNSHLAAFESRELAQIDRALIQLKSGQYGKCETCSASIPIERLKALPFTTLCIACQQAEERDPSLRNREKDVRWDSVAALEGAHSDRDMGINDISMPVDY